MSNFVFARNAASVLISDVAIRILSGFGVVLIARSLGPRSYGILSVALAFSAVVAYLSDLGLTHLTIQHATKPGADMGCILGTIFRVRLALTIGASAASLMWIGVMYPEPEQRAVMLIVTLPTICGVAMQGFAASYFWAAQELHIAAGLKTAGQLFCALALIGAFWFRWPVCGVALVYGASSVLAGIACLWIVRRRVPRMAGWNPRLLRGLAAFTIAGVSATALPQIGPLIMQHVAGAVETGFFAAASRIPGVLYAIPAAFGMAWYPRLFQAGARDRAQHLVLAVEQLKLNMILGMGLSLVVSLNPGLLIRLALGPKWEPGTAPLLSLLCWMVVLNSLSAPFADALTTLGLQFRRAWVYGASLSAGAILFALLASARGALGAAHAAVYTQALLSAGLVLANPAGPEMLIAGIRRVLRPVALGSAALIVTHIALPETVVTVAFGGVLFFLAAVTADVELRRIARRGAQTIFMRLRYA